MPTPSEFWQDGIITDYIDPATGGNYTPVLVPTPESFASTSVPTGLADLNALFGIIYAHAAYGNGPLPEEVPAIGQDIENVLEQTDTQQALIDPTLGLFGPLGGLFSS